MSINHLYRLQSPESKIILVLVEDWYLTQIRFICNHTSMRKKHTQCSVDGCTGIGGGPNRNSFVHGWCHMHYTRFKRLGSVELPLRAKKLFVAGVCKVPDCGMPDKYGRLGFCGRHYSRNRVFGYPDAPINHHAEKSFCAENKLASIFAAHGHQVQRIKRRQDGDLLVDGKFKIEVKCAEAQHGKDEVVWKFNIHRHGILNEVSDYYVFQFLGVPGSKSALYAAFKAPLGVLTLQFSLRKMIRELAPAVKLYEELIAAQPEETQQP